MAQKHHKHVTKPHQEHSRAARADNAEIEREEEAALTGTWKRGAGAKWLAIIISVAFVIALIGWQYWYWFLRH